MKLVFKKVVLVISVLLLFGCKNSHSKYVSLSGKISNFSQDTLRIQSASYTKKIPLSDKGTFDDTLQVEKGYFRLYVGKYSTPLFLKNGYDMHITADARNFYNSVTYRGKGAENSNYILAKSKFVRDKLGRPRDYFKLDRDSFELKVSKLKKKLDSMLTDKGRLDDKLVSDEESLNRHWINYLHSNYQRQHQIYVKLSKGKPSPVFKDYPNYQGNRTSLDDFRGKFVYISIWKVDCDACIKEISGLKKLQQEYSDKNIVFVSLFADRMKDYDRWKKLVAKKKLPPPRLFTASGLYTPFMKDYNITKVPSHILIDPQGKIVSADAPAPTSPALKKILDEVGI